MLLETIFRNLASSIGWSPDLTDRASFGGDTDPILPTCFRVGSAGAAAIAASGLAAVDLWMQRTGRLQKVSVDVRQAAAAMRSGSYLRIDNVGVPEKYNAIMGTYRTKDGRWVYIHTNFPQQRAAALAVLGCKEDRQAVSEAFATWNAHEFEDALVEAKGAGGVVRSPAEWRAYDQAQAIADLPLIEIQRIGDSPIEPLRGGTRPLSGVRAIDVTRLIAGPTCARTLAEHGADVLKISARHLPDFGTQEFDVGHGKLSTYLDLRQNTDVETLRNLVREADVFSQSYRPGALAGLGFSPDSLIALRPGLIYVSLSAFSHIGPWASRRGYDSVIQAVTGFAARQAEVMNGPAAAPRFNPVSAIDYCAGYLLAAGAMVALKRRAVEGGSWLVRTSLAQVGKWIAELGEVENEALRQVPGEFPPDELDSWSMATKAPHGLLHHLKPVVRMSETPPFWIRPAVPLGYHLPDWPPRETWTSSYN